eukprot:TRINITY_DN55902_c0_g1_i1.p1 TRINITY_DN55902_c0_g1~~TRINITY_DN55902_c0_g1_i1.p1  ORF type:complete len:347 (+),score=54.48 TRINITY_DN55902_c0_g1_i1:41-1081(+)
MSASPSKTDMTIKVHNAELYIELLRQADFSASPGLNLPRDQPSRGEENAVTKANYLTKQRVREQEFNRKLEQAKQLTEKRLAEKQRKRENEFEEKFSKLVEEKETFVSEVNRSLDTAEFRDLRRRELLYQQWTERVFKPILSMTTSDLPAAEIERRRREQFEQYLQACRRNGGALFRDIILESEYDPLGATRENTLKYSHKSAHAVDPTQSRAQREAIEERAIAGLPPLPQSKLRGKTREVFDPRQWNKVESTPHGRYSVQNTRQHRKKMVETDSPLYRNVLPDDYDVPVGTRAKELLTHELGGVGKRIVGPPVAEVRPQRHVGKRVTRVPALPEAAPRQTSGLFV